MAKIVDPHNLPDRKLSIPGLKPPVCADQLVTDDGDPREADQFNRMLRELRDQGAAGAALRQHRTP